jgi:hypothetical protein
LFLLCPALLASGQISQGGEPRSWRIPVSPDIRSLHIEAPPAILEYGIQLDEDKSGLPYHIAEAIPVSIDLASEAGVYSVEGSTVLSLSLRVPGARGLILYYEAFNIPEGGKLFLYTPDRSFLRGAFTEKNNAGGGAFATSLSPGEEIILEYEHPQGILPDIRIQEIGFAFRDNLFPWLAPEGFGSSQWCEVNVNCPEGAQWQDEKRGVAFILVKSGGGTYYCSGSLVNTTAYDMRPYLLTADHCGQDATALELEQWVFYFNWEASGCSNPPSEPPHDEMAGCSRLASAGGSGGSISGADFFLVMLDDSVPPQYNPYFNGWTRENIASPSGVGIHHPAGDIKKISTYTTPTYTTQWGGTQGTHWGLRWAATVTNQGVTEGGSSGSPLFNDKGLIMGVLSGGDASCNAQNEPDLYGKISYAWNNGPTPDRRLMEWLDPLNTGATSVSGTYGNTVFVVADFEADTTVIPVNSTLDFHDRSFGNPTSWYWTFEGGKPEVSESQNPTGILFEQTGSFSISLRATNGETTDENIKLAYIKVFPTVYFDGEANALYVNFGKRDIDGLDLSLYDVLGRTTPFTLHPGWQQGVYRIEVPGPTSGVFLLSVRTQSFKEALKLVFTKP